MPKMRYRCICFFRTRDKKPPQKFKRVGSMERFYAFALTKGFIYFNVYKTPPKGSPKDTRGEFVQKVWIEENFRPSTYR